MVSAVKLTEFNSLRKRVCANKRATHSIIEHSVYAQSISIENANAKHTDKSLTLCECVFNYTCSNCIT